MLKTEASTERTTLRSASPHRNAYRAEFQALKKAFDQPRLDDDPSKQKDPERVRQPRGRQYGAHVSRIKDMFMQMGTDNSNGTKGRRGDTSPQKLTKPTNFINRADGSVIKLQHGTVDRSGNSKFSETRKLFEQNSRDTSQSPVSSFGRDKRGSHEHLDDWRGPRSNRGSTDSLDSLCSRNEASSPTVSQLSAVFENAERHQHGGPGPFLRRSHSAGRAVCSPDGQQHHHGDLSEDDSSLRQSPVRSVYRTRIGGGKLPVSSSSEDLLSPSPLAESAEQKRLDRERKLGQKIEEAAKESEDEHKASLDSAEVDGVLDEKLDGQTANAETTRVDSPQVNDTDVSKAPRETPESPSTKPQDEAAMQNHHEDEKKTSRTSEDLAEEADEEYCGNERVIFNADGDACYQGWAESCTDDDVDDDVSYDPGSEVTEIPGLPEEPEDEVPQGRKIRFSTSPMTVSVSPAVPLPFPPC
ncbi:hypothetical protein ACEWY4_024070 [Coilia grayii]|uniref:Uncharacterized protein n=1 Tax=Coilia grayii TaxID=363190 RepID=A0ABD1IZK9_9TELE